MSSPTAALIAELRARAAANRAALARRQADARAVAAARAAASNTRSR